MSERLEIRRATEADYAEILAAVRQYFAYDQIQFDETRVPAGLRELIGDARLGRVWVVRDVAAARPTPSLAGYAILGFGFDLEFGGRQATLTDLFISSEYRRRGLARRLFAEIERDCRESGIGAIELQAETDNEEALALYASLGFVHHTRQPMSKRLR